jgi:hypothetical protein
MVKDNFSQIKDKESHIKEDYDELLLLLTLIPLSGVGTTCFSSCCDKDSAFIFTTGRLPDVNPP